MSVKVIQHYMDFFTRTASYHFVHEIQKLPAPTAGIVSSLHQSRSHLKCGKQGGSAMSLVLMIKSSHGLAIWQTQPALGTFQRLNRRLLINAYDKGILRWLKVETYYIRGFLGKLGVCAHAPTSASPQVNTMLAQHSPNLVIGNVPDALSQKFSRPHRMPFWGRIIQGSQNKLLGSLVILLTPASPWVIRKSREPLLGKADTPFAYRPRTQCHLLGDLLGHSSRCTIEYNAGPLYKALLR